MPFIIKKGVVYGGSGDGIRYTEQALTEEQQTQARTNIGATSKNEVSKLSEEMACKWVLISNGETETKIDGSSYEISPIIKCVIPNTGGDITFADKTNLSIHSSNFPWQSVGLREEIYRIGENISFTASASISVYILDDEGYSYLKKDINKLSEDIADLKENGAGSGCEVYVGSDTPPENATIWIDPIGEPTSTEEWEFEMDDGTTETKTVVVVN